MSVRLSAFAFYFVPVAAHMRYMLAITSSPENRASTCLDNISPRCCVQIFQDRPIFLRCCASGRMVGGQISGRKKMHKVFFLSPRSKWRADLNGMSKQVYNLLGAARQRKTTAPSIDPDDGSVVITTTPPPSPPPTSRKKNVGIVSYCNYGNSSFPLPRYSRTNKQAYADLHGYKLYHIEQPFVKQAHPWANKLLAVRNFLKEHDYIMWVDCDAYFMRKDVRVEGLVAEGGDFFVAEVGFFAAEVAVGFCAPTHNRFSVFFRCMR